MLAATSDDVIEGLECVGSLKTTDDITSAKRDLSSGSPALPDRPDLGGEQTRRSSRGIAST